ncbi:MAG: VIT1/CCC1 transporter family protein [Phaeodactylibacter sp.]|nr:VIT1/CCC1 transporter family protein [Phaeodactylibacter sp.]
MRSRLAQLQAEADTAFLYRRFAEMEEDETVAHVFRELSKIEEQHAAHLLRALQQEQAGIRLPEPSTRARLQAAIARVMGYSYVLPNLLDTERSMANSVVRSKQQAGQPVTGGELNHVRILDSLSGNVSGGQLAKMEGRHKAVGGNALRAAVLGANDGLVSNMSLVMGVAGAAAGSREILVAGFAGLLAGSISMALGEWLSVQSSRELYQKQIDIEIEEIEADPESEKKELALIYQAKGVDAESARRLAGQVFENKDSAYATLVREELGIDPDELGGSAWEAAIASFVLFAIGAIIPIIPYLFLSGSTAIFSSLAISTVGLFAIGAAITLFTGRGVAYSGFRQVLFGLAAAAITFGIGHLIGVSLEG